MSESQVRKLAARKGLRLRKVAERSRWYHQYGTFMLVDAKQNVIVEWAIPDLEVVGLRLAS